MISVKAKLDERKMKSFRKKFGETSNQALIRLAVDVAKDAAVLTEPKGKSKKQIVKNIISGARVNIAAIPARQFNQISKKKSPWFRFSKGGVSLSRAQILESPGEINGFIERNRNKKGRVRRLSQNQKAICKTGDMNKVLVKRKKLAGVTKGSWLGAGIKLSRKSKGSHPARVGKNFMAFAQKHKDRGTAKFRARILGKSEAFLISNAPATKDVKIFSKRDAKEAIRRAWKKVLNYYRREVRARVAS